MHKSKKNYKKVVSIVSKHLGIFIVFIGVALNFFEQNACSKNIFSIATAKNIHTKNNSIKDYNLKQNHSSFFHRSKYKFSSLTHLPVLSDGQSALPSNANNFHGMWNASVDPRTGSSSFSLAMGNILYAQGQAKYSLSLSYVGGSSALGADFFGLGPHWSWNIGTEHASTSEVAGHLTRDINTGSGYSFTMESDRDKHGNTVWHPLRHKLKDVIITGKPEDWTISMSNGIREHISHGFEDWQENRTGFRVWFYYDSDNNKKTRHLKYICAHQLTFSEVASNKNSCIDDGIWITNKGSNITVNGLQKFTIKKRSTIGIDQIQSIIMPVLSSQNIISELKVAPSIINFTYDLQGNHPWLLQNIEYPTGITTTFLYNQESDRHDAQIAGLPTGINGALIPVVTEKTTKYKNDPTQNKRLWYYYHGYGNNALHNFTGFQSGGVMIPGRDNLLDRPDSYIYSVSQDNGLTTTTTTYNKYHLPLLVEQKNDSNGLILSSNEKNYVSWKNTVFGQLPGNYSLPIQTKKTLYTVADKNILNNANVKHIKQFARYDKAGKIIWSRNALGSETFTQYCPAEGDNHCPKSNPNWPSLGYPEKIIVMPAKKINKNSSSSSVYLSDSEYNVTETVFDYTTITNRAKASVINSHGFHGNTLNQTQSNSSFWQVKKKTIGILDRKKIPLLKAGDKLAELPVSSINNTTTYYYNRNIASHSYGLLQHIEVESHAKSLPNINGYLLKLSSVKAEPTPVNNISIDVIQDINPASGLRTVTMQLPETNKTDNTAKYLQQSGVQLGTTVYSLKTGSKILSFDQMKNLTHKWVYDSQLRPIKEIAIIKNVKNPHITTWNYIVSLKEIAVVETDFLGNQIKTVLDEDGKVIASLHRNKNFSNTSMLGEKNWIKDISKRYTSTGKISRVTVWHAADKHAAQAGKSIPLTTTFGYDILNRNIWTKGPTGLINISVYDDPAMRIIKYEVATAENKEILNPIVQVVQANILGKPEVVYEFSLDANATKNNHKLYLNNLRNMLQNIRHIKSVDSLHTLNSYGLLPTGGSKGLLAFVKQAIAQKAWLTHTTTGYDSEGHKISYTSGNGATSHFIWDKENLAAIIAPDGRTIHDSYDLSGNKISRCVKTVDSNVCHVLGTRQFSVDGNLLWQADEYGNKIEFEYDADGRLIKTIIPATKDSPKGHTYTWKYNSFGMIEARVDGVIVIQKSYDPITWKISDQEDKISHTHYSYDPITGLLKKVIRSPATKLGKDIKKHNFHYFNGTVNISYDRYSQLTSVTNILGTTYTSEHDKFGRIKYKKVQLINDDKPSILAKYNYDSFGRVTDITNGLGIKRVFKYNAYNQLESSTDFIKNKKLDNLNYTYNIDTGNIVSFIRSENNLSATQRYQYDINNNLKSMQCSDSSNQHNTSQLCPREIAMQDSGIKNTAIITSQDYTFDSWNNIHQVTEKLFDDNSNKSLTKNITYFYARKSSLLNAPESYDPHRLISFDIHWSTQHKSFTPFVLKYDSSGRIIQDADGNKLHYNAMGQQDEFTNVQTGEKTNYWYDADGHQVIEQPFNAKGVKLQPPHYRLYSGSDVVAHMQKDSKGDMRQVEMLQGLAKVVNGKINNWFLHDYKGDVLLMLNNKGIIQAENLYSPYGMQVNRLNDIKLLPESLHIASQKPWWEIYNPGFDGQMTDFATGYQFLGGGYRAYNPVYKHFMSRDSFSPFKKIDGYGFGDNNPIMNTDPTGHMPNWLGYAMGGLAIAMSATMGLLLPVVTAAIAPSLAFTGAAIGASATMGLVGVASGSLQIANTAHPENKNLSITNQAFGVANGLVDLGFGGLGMAAGISLLSTDISAITKVVTIGSAAGSAASGTLGAGGSGAAITSIINPSTANAKGFNTALSVINYVGMGIMVPSIFMGIIGIGKSISHITKGNLESSAADENDVNPQSKVLDSIPRPVERDAFMQRVFDRSELLKAGKMIEIPEVIKKGSLNVSYYRGEIMHKGTMIQRFYVDFSEENPPLEFSRGLSGKMKAAREYLFNVVYNDFAKTGRSDISAENSHLVYMYSKKEFDRLPTTWVGPRNESFTVADTGSKSLSVKINFAKM